MLLSCLLHQPGYSEHFRRFSPTQAVDSIQVPSVTRLQKAIEEAWEQGFDVQVKFKQLSSSKGHFSNQSCCLGL